MFCVPSEEDISLAILREDVSKLPDCCLSWWRAWLRSDFVLGYTNQVEDTFLQAPTFPLLDAAMGTNAEVFEAVLLLTTSAPSHYQKLLEVLQHCARHGKVQQFDALTRMRLPLERLRRKDRAILITGHVMYYMTSIDRAIRTISGKVPANAKDNGLAILKKIWRSGDHGVDISGLRLNEEEKKTLF